MTQNNTMTLEDAKKLLDEYKRIGLSGYVERFYEGDPIGARPHFLVSENKVIPYIDRLIEAARTVQRAEDIEILENNVADLVQENISYYVIFRNLDDQYQDYFTEMAYKIQEDMPKLLNPEAPLSDNQK